MITIEDNELAALLRVIIEAKFRADPFDEEIPDSELVAGIAERACAERLRLDSEKMNPAAIARAEDWRKLTPDRREWKAALEFAKRRWVSVWAAWPTEERRRAVRTLLSPYRLSDELLDTFLAAV